MVPGLRAFVICTVGLVLPALPGAAPPPALTSTWRTQPVVVDGVPDEWPPLVALERGPGIAVVNDDEFVYFLVSSSDPQVRDLMAFGLIVWLDPALRKTQTFGIWSPGPVEPPLPGAVPEPTPLDSPTGVFAEVLDRFDLLGPGKNQRRLIDITPGLGIELACGVREGAVIYEMKIPLKKTEARLYAIGAGGGATIGIGVATPEAPRRAGRRGPLVGSSGVIGGAGAYGPGLGGTNWAPYRERNEQPKPLAIWTTLKLAAR